jgi:diguanylate cyclase (GGDEF)-like protein
MKPRHDLRINVEQNRAIHCKIKSMEDIRDLPQDLEANLRAWRARVLRRLLTLGVILILPALIQTLLRAYHNPAERLGAGALLLVYLFAGYLTIRSDLNDRMRGWGTVLIIYASGVISLTRGGLAGDGRVYLVVLPILAATLIGIRAGWFTTVLSLVTYSLFGGLAVAGLLENWLIIKVNPVEPDHWIYDGLVLFTLMISMIVLLNNFIQLLLRSLHSEHNTLDALQRTYRLLEQTNLTLEQKVEQRTSELAEANHRLLHQATHDALTGLPNRVLFFDRLNQAVLHAGRSQNSLAVLFIDLDDFKQVNDTYGHARGDALLCEVARRISLCVRDIDTVARLSGDEFTVILEGLSGPEDADVVIDKIKWELSEPVTADNLTIHTSASIGRSIFPTQGDDVEALLRHADVAMYHIKAASKDGNSQASGKKS